MRWVEDGLAPSTLVASKLDAKGKATATRPTYEYPYLAVDTTGGPTDQASSYTRQRPRGTFDGDVTWLGSFRTGYERVCQWEHGRRVCRAGKTER